jgi:hypothetical protein
MRTAIAWLIGIAAVLHGAIHLVVAASGFGWAGPALWGYRADGPGSLRVEYRRAVAAAEGTLATRRGDDGGVVTDADVDPLPPPVAAWVRASGAVGRPHVLGFEATITGRIRSGPEAPWMSFEGAQVNTFGDMPSRVFLLDATMKGLPADVLHSC